MKKYSFISSVALVFAVCAACTSVNDNSAESATENLTPKEQWSPTYKGSDFTVPQLPDLFVNYWDYCYNVEENSTMGLRVSGEFPQCRYFSFSTYDDDNGTVVSGMSDYEIEPDEGCVNPFVVTSTEKNTYTVWIIPFDTPENLIANIPCKNIIKLGEGVKRADLMIREYLGIDEYGGTDLPAIQAFDLSTMKEMNTPKRMQSNVWKEIDPEAFTPQWFDSETDVPFMLSPTGQYYPNNATNYLFCRTAIEADQVLTYSFIPAPYPKTVEEYKGAPCRYWSMCYGTQYDTRSYYSVYDAQCNVPDGEMATFVVCLKQNPQLAEIEKTVNDAKANGQYIFLTVWDSERPSYFGADKPIGNTITAMYRNILPNEEWEHSMKRMKPVEYGDPVTYSMQDPDNMQADLALHEYGPRGKKVSTQEFLNEMKGED